MIDNKKYQIKLFFSSPFISVHRNLHWASSAVSLKRPAQWEDAADLAREPR